MEMGAIGITQDQGVTRLALSETHMAAKNWLISRAREAGLEVEIDPALNVICRLRSVRSSGGKTLIAGSHLDTVPNSGRFDGALGVLAALECARVLLEHGLTLPCDLEVIDFTDEEGYHNAGTIGSRAMLGLLKQGEIHEAKMKGIPTFAQDMERLGYDPNKIVAAKRDPSHMKAYLELHIEQGDQLESSETAIGAVTGIVGIYRYDIRVVGEANHAGTMLMQRRKDALVMAAPLFQLLPQWVRARSSKMVGTIGQLTLEPGAMNIIPGECRFIVELRSMESQDMIAIRELLKEWVASHPGSSIRTILEKDSVQVAAPLVDAVVRAAETEGLQVVRMASGAGHDAQSFAKYVPAGMIFVPSKSGKSHCPEEWTSPENVTKGCQVLLNTIIHLAQND
jgi:hydantoinase/carbamoylase family amidase